MSNRWFLFKRFLRNPTRIGAITPSGPALCRMLVDHLDLAHARAVAELGPGTGVVTREIVRNCGELTTFFAVELDPVIYAAFQKMLPDVQIFNADAACLDDLCRRAGVDALDSVISGLPWAAFPEAVQSAILSAVLRSLAPGGKFVTFAYLQGLPLPAGRRFRQLLDSKFSQVSLSPVVWNNLPPAVVYRCCK